MNDWISPYLGGALSFLKNLVITDSVRTRVFRDLMAKEIEEPRPCISWDDYFMGVACLSAHRSKDPAVQVGACIVNGDNRIVGIGYNGMPDGLKVDVDSWSKEAKRPYVCHAEMNAILNGNTSSMKGCKIYTTLFPCNECAKLIVQAGISEVVYLCDMKHDKPSTEAARVLFTQKGVAQFKPNLLSKTILLDFENMREAATVKEQKMGKKANNAP